MEGKEMHHCVSNYAHYIVDGRSYIYSVEYQGKKAATLELGMEEKRHSKNSILNVISSLPTYHTFKIKQLRAQCNKEPSSALKKAVYKWFNQNNKSTQLSDNQNKQDHVPANNELINDFEVAI